MEPVDDAGAVGVGRHIDLSDEVHAVFWCWDCGVVVDDEARGVGNRVRAAVSRPEEIPIVTIG